MSRRGQSSLTWQQGNDGILYSCPLVLWGSAILSVSCAVAIERPAKIRGETRGRELQPKRKRKKKQKKKGPDGTVSCMMYYIRALKMNKDMERRNICH